MEEEYISQEDLIEQLIKSSKISNIGSLNIFTDMIVHHINIVSDNLEDENHSESIRIALEAIINHIKTLNMLFIEEINKSEPEDIDVISIKYNPDQMQN